MKVKLWSCLRMWSSWWWLESWFMLIMRCKGWFPWIQLVKVENSRISRWCHPKWLCRFIIFPKTWYIHFLKKATHLFRTWTLAPFLGYIARKILQQPQPWLYQPSLRKKTLDSGKTSRETRWITNCVGTAVFFWEVECISGIWGIKKNRGQGVAQTMH